MAEAPKDPVDTFGLEVLRKAAEEDPNLTSKYRLRTFADGSFRPKGLNVGGKITPVTLDSTSWTALPATPLSNRNAMSIQNQSTVEIKLNYNNGQAGYVGVIVGVDAERYYDITDDVVIYAKASSGTPTIIVEEIA